jgi:hypothetical protein
MEIAWRFTRLTHLINAEEYLRVKEEHEAKKREEH